MNKVKSQWYKPVIVTYVLTTLLRWKRKKHSIENQ